MIFREPTNYFVNKLNNNKSKENFLLHLLIRIKISQNGMRITEIKAKNLMLKEKNSKKEFSRKYRDKRLASPIKSFLISTIFKEVLNWPRWWILIYNWKVTAQFLVMTLLSLKLPPKSIKNLSSLTQNIFKGKNGPKLVCIWLLRAKKIRLI